MTRIAQETDFTVDVEGFGRFIFGRRRKEDVFKIRSRYNVLTEGNYMDDGRVADMGALSLVTLQTLMVSGPESFSLDALDPLMDDDWENKVMAIFTALRAKELSFRQRAPEEGKAAGPGTSQ